MKRNKFDLIMDYIDVNIDKSAEDTSFFLSAASDRYAGNCQTAAILPECAVHGLLPHWKRPQVHHPPAGRRHCFHAAYPPWRFWLRWHWLTWRISSPASCTSLAPLRRKRTAQRLISPRWAFLVSGSLTVRFCILLEIWILKPSHFHMFEMYLLKHLIC